MDGRRPLQGVEVPSFAGHGVGEVVHVEGSRREGDGADERLPHDGEVVAQGRVLPEGRLDLLGGVDDLVTAVDVAAFALGHQAGPAGGDEGSGTGACDARRGVHASGPIRGDEVLIGAERWRPIEKDGVSFGGEAVFVGVAGDACHAF